MANVTARDATGTIVYLSSTGTGVLGDPYVPVHAATVSSGTITTVGTVTTVATVTAVTAVTTLSNGQGAAGSAIAGNPVRTGVRAKTAQPTAVTDGQAAEVLASTIGAQVVTFGQVPELTWQFAVTAAVTNTADTAVAAAAGAGLRNYCTGIQVFSGSATATQVVLKDGATVIWRGYLPASATAAPVCAVFSNPIRTTANTALNFACITTATSTIFSAQGFIAP